MRIRLLLCVCLTLVGCTKKAEDNRPPPNQQQQQQVLAPAPDCAEFGKTMRSLAFRDAAGLINKTVPEGCRAQWGARLDVVAQSFWLQLDCTKPETRMLLDLYLATPTELRANPEAFPNDPKASPSVGAFIEGAAPVKRTTAEEILRLIDEQLDGGCPRAQLP